MSSSLLLVGIVLGVTILIQALTLWAAWRISRKADVALVETLLQKYDPFRRTLPEDLVKVLGAALPGFSQAMAELGPNLDRLGGVVEKQRSLFETAIGDLQGLATTTESLTSSSAVLAKASAALQELPESLESKLAESRQQWLTDRRREEGAPLEAVLSFHRELEQRSEDRERQMASFVLSLRSSVAEVGEEISRLPGLLADVIGRLSSQLGIEFGQHARNSINELAADLKNQQELLLLRLEKREQEMRNNIGVIVKELFDELSAGKPLTDLKGARPRGRQRRKAG